MASMASTCCSGGRIGAEIGRAALPQTRDEFEGQAELAVRAAGMAPLRRQHELADGRQRRRAGHAVVGDVGEAVRLQPLTNRCTMASCVSRATQLKMPCRATTSASLSPPRAAASWKLASERARFSSPAAATRRRAWATCSGLKSMPSKATSGLAAARTRPKTLAEAEFEETLRLQRPARRAAGCEGGEGEMRGCGLAVEAGRVADIGDVAARPIHAPLPFVRTTIGRLPRRLKTAFRRTQFERAK